MICVGIYVQKTMFGALWARSSQSGKNKQKILLNFNFYNVFVFGWQGEM